jgi:hypothetical protein
MRGIVDPNAPTQEEREEHSRKVAAHNLKVAKANLASSICEKLCSCANVMSDYTPEETANYAIAIAEHILETYSLMPDAAGNKGGIVS